MRKKVFSINTQLYKVTGVEKVMIDIHHAIKGVYDAKIVGSIPYEKVNMDHHIPPSEYVCFHNPFMFYNSIVIVHERRLLMLLWFLNNFLFQRIKVVYVHHNLFYNHVRTTMLPNTIVAIADRGIENLVEVFKVPREHIHKIYNCVRDEYVLPHRDYNRNLIRLLLPGRINNQKQQTEIVKHLRGKLGKHVKIMFAGDGPQLEDLRIQCKGDSQFEVLGYRSDIHKLMQECDYVFLFSVHEGLPITLIEAAMLGVPIICSNVGGNPEICHNGENGWVVDDWNQLIEVINILPEISSVEYRQMCSESRKIYEENFIFETFKQNYLRLLTTL